MIYLLKDLLNYGCTALRKSEFDADLDSARSAILAAAVCSLIVASVCRFLRGDDGLQKLRWLEGLGRDQAQTSRSSDTQNVYRHASRHSHSFCFAVLADTLDLKLAIIPINRKILLQYITHLKILSEACPQKTRKS